MNFSLQVISSFSLKLKSRLLQKILLNEEIKVAREREIEIEIEREREGGGGGGGGTGFHMLWEY